MAISKIKVSAMTPKTTLSDSDEFLISDSAGGSKKVSFQDMITALQDAGVGGGGGEVPPIDISGIDDIDGRYRLSSHVNAGTAELRFWMCAGDQDSRGDIASSHAVGGNYINYVYNSDANTHADSWWESSSNISKGIGDAYLSSMIAYPSFDFTANPGMLIYIYDKRMDISKITYGYYKNTHLYPMIVSNNAEMGFGDATDSGSFKNIYSRHQYSDYINGAYKRSIGGVDQNACCTQLLMLNNPVAPGDVSSLDTSDFVTSPATVTSTTTGQIIPMKKSYGLIWPPNTSNALYNNRKYFPGFNFYRYTSNISTSLRYIQCFLIPRGYSAIIPPKAAKGALKSSGTPKEPSNKEWIKLGTGNLSDFYAHMYTGYTTGSESSGYSYFRYKRLCNIHPKKFVSLGNYDDIGMYYMSHQDFSIIKVDLSDDTYNFLMSINNLKTLFDLPISDYEDDGDDE